MNKINLENKKLCKICMEYKPLEDFYCSSRGYYYSYCKPCDRTRPNKKTTAKHAREWREKNPEKQKVIRTKSQLKRYGLTLLEYNNLLSQQNGTCAICGNLSDNKNLAVDHDHLTGKVRGLLCVNCNLILGLAKDNPQILKNLIDYLNK